MVANINEITSDQLLDAEAKASEAGKLYQICVHQKLLFAERSKDYLSALKMQLRVEHENCDTTHKEYSETELETRARASEEWKKFRQEQMRSLQEHGKREVQYHDAVRLWETRRSLLSIRRAEIDRFKA